jgi:hypothetical protein
MVLITKGWDGVALEDPSETALRPSGDKPRPALMSHGGTPQQHPSICENLFRSQAIKR